ncbi:nucleobase:cation symporter-2 family protein [Buttiauxella selenatireducens]|uniref:Nucleobase:cation symporter-2 family protein n=1 Tax=Buttiauxella selenatireducens TaxID=3073902 RepID=A0ABY9SGP4_9ENTR|nr:MULTISPECIES: nucleobase:cation symporter-2 family protein [unclassified Buttiauxella]WMY76584.1 nucleobase:cation symporter-2 family protein [Buttiauxella sp. R73]GDX03881.1 purine permease [Buttiauxella sp. A111]
MNSSSQLAARRSVEPVDEILPLGLMIIYGFQHVLVMYAGAIAVPLIIGKAVGFTDSQIILLISTDLCICGCGTILQSIGIGRWIGSRLPIIQGCTFAALIPLSLIGQQYGMGGISGAVIVAGIFTILCAPWISRLVRFFPKVVMGTIVTLIGLSILPVAGGWIGGGNTHAADFGSWGSLVMAVFTLVVILVIYTFSTGMLKNIAVLLGIIVGSLVYVCMGKLTLTPLDDIGWITFPTVMRFAKPEFHLVPAVLLSMVMIVVMVETMSSMMAMGEIVGRKADKDVLKRGLYATGAATLAAGFFNMFPYAAFAQNVGLVSMTGVRSRFIVGVAGCILIVMGLFPVLAAMVVAVPKPVLGGAGIVMFGMVAVAGIRTLGQVDYRNNNNGMVVALTLSIGLLPVLVPQLFQHLPEGIGMFLHSGITIGTAVAIVANLALNGGRHHEPVCDCNDNEVDNTTTAARSAAIRTVRVWLLVRRARQERAMGIQKGH